MYTGMPDSRLIGCLAVRRNSNKRAEPTDWEAVSNHQASRPGNERRFIENGESESLVPSLIPSGNQSRLSVIEVIPTPVRVSKPGLNLAAGN